MGTEEQGAQRKTDLTIKGAELKTTVVIPNYEGAEYLENCLASLERCKNRDFEVIVVDNGSRDGSEAAAEAHFPWVRLIRFTHNKGFPEAVNAGIAAARTEYVMLLNNDTTVEPDCVKRLEQRMDSDSRIFSAGAKMVSMKEPERMDGAGDLYSALGWAYSIGKDKPSRLYNKPMQVFSASGGASMYRKELLQKTGLFDEAHFTYLEDVDIGYRARILGYRNVYEPGAVVLHAGSASSGSRYNAFKISHSSRNNVYLIYKNMPFVQLLLNLPFLAAGFFIKTLFFCAKGFGGVYLKGLGQGIKLSASPQGRSRKVKFRAVNLRHYCRIQLELWINMFRRL